MRQIQSTKYPTERIVHLALYAVKRRTVPPLMILRALLFAEIDSRSLRERQDWFPRLEYKADAPSPFYLTFTEEFVFSVHRGGTLVEVFCVFRLCRLAFILGLVRHFVSIVWPIRAREFVVCNAVSLQPDPRDAATRRHFQKMQAENISSSCNTISFLFILLKCHSCCTLTT